MSTRQNISLTEDFAAPSMVNYSTYQAITDASGMGRSGGDLPYNFGLSTQDHIDIATFSPSEGWANTGIYSSGYQSSLNHNPALIITPATNALQVAARSFASPIDLSTFDPDGFVTLALPSFPLSSIDLTQSFVSFHDGAASVILSFSGSLSTIVSGNTYGLWPINVLLNNGVTSITLASIGITNTTHPITVTLAALRAVGAQWVPTNVDFDTLNGRLHPSLPLNGDVTAVTPINQRLPLVWRSAPVPGVDDPRPINGEFGILFNTGSQTKQNSFTLYMREQTQAYITQLDLEGETQASLTGQPQPTTGISEFSPRTIADMEQWNMGQLDRNSMLDLERVENPVFQNWISFNVQWGTSTSVQINNSSNATSNNPGYQYNLASLSNNTLYLITCNLTDTSARLQVWNLNQSTLALINPVFDSTVIPDSYMFPRQAGRVGWTASLLDGDTYVESISPRSLMFAEYLSKPLPSLTPVAGARLYAQNTQDTSLFTSWSPLADGDDNAPIITADQQRYVGTVPDNTSVKVTVTVPSTGSPTQGIISNLLSAPGDPINGITQWDQLNLDFSLWVPQASVITATLVSPQGNTIPITLPTITPNQWSSISIIQPILPPYPISGLYQLVLHYTGSDPITFWVDGVKVSEAAVRWEARSVVSDPWNSNYAPWTPFYDKINSDSNGVKFTTVGSSLQVRGQALRQDAAILSSPTVVPQYAQLGRLVWPENAPTLTPLATPTFTISNTGRTFSFAASVGSGNYYWSFGDGSSGTGPTISHTYASYLTTGTQFTATLTYVSPTGQAASSIPTLITLP